MPKIELKRDGRLFVDNHFIESLAVNEIEHRNELKNSYLMRVLPACANMDDLTRSIELAKALWQKGAFVQAAIQIDICAARLGLQKYDSNQPRIPIGEQGGGRWTSQDVSTEGRSDSDADDGTTSYMSRIDLDCEMRYKVDSLLCRALKSRSCWAQAAERYAACLSGRPIPPMNF